MVNLEHSFKDVPHKSKGCANAEKDDKPIYLQALTETPRQWGTFPEWDIVRHLRGQSVAIDASILSLASIYW
jgi:hypothetical protein